MKQISDSIQKLCFNNIRDISRRGDVLIIQSPNLGGIFEISGSAEEILENNLNNNKIFSWLRRRIWEFSQSNSIFQITSFALTNNPFQLPPFHDRCIDFLEQIVEKNHPINKGIMVDQLEADYCIHAILGTNNLTEATFYLEYLNQRQFIKYAKELTVFTILPDALVYLDREAAQSNRLQQAFVAMNFDPAFNFVFEEGIEPAIKATGFSPKRIDKSHHLNPIDDEILSQIRQSRFVVSDFSNPPNQISGGVYFEAGFAKGLGLPVIWTVRKEDLNRIHFDTRQYNHIIWESTSELREKLKARIVANLGIGPNGLSGDV